MVFEMDLPRFDEINLKIYSGNLQVDESIVGACDINWLKEYEDHYHHNKYCKPYATRLSFKDENQKKMGFVNIRLAPCPECVASELSETYLRPPDTLMDGKTNFVTCLGSYDQYAQLVECVPFIMPEGTLNVCAQASTWIILKIIENLSQTPCSEAMPAIQRMATGVPWSDGAGLTLKSVSRLLQKNHCGTFYFNSERMPLNEEGLINLIYAYVESGLPVLLGVDVNKLSWWGGHKPDNHALVIIGHQMDNSGKISGFILHDESMYPYLTITKNELLVAWRAANEEEIIREAVVTTPPEVLVPFETANNVTKALVAELGKLNFSSADFHIRPLLKHINEIDDVIEKFLKDNSNAKIIKYGLRERGDNPEYVWVFLLHSSADKRLSQESEGIILIDALDLPTFCLCPLTRKH